MNEIKCDTCDAKFEVEWEEIPKFHNVVCEECGIGILVTDEDMETYNSIQALIDAGWVSTPDDDGDEEEHAMRVVVSTDGKGGVSVQPKPYYK